MFTFCAGESLIKQRKYWDWSRTGELAIRIMTLSGTFRFWFLGEATLQSQSECVPLQVGVLPDVTLDVASLHKLL